MTRIADADLLLNSDGSIYHLGLLPEHINDVVITVGDPDRVTQITDKFDSVEFKRQNREFVTHVGTFRNHRLTVMSTGIGTDNIELFMTELDALVNVDFNTRESKAEKRKLKIIRIGTSGALQPEIPVGAHLCSEYAVGLDALVAYYNLPMTEYEKSIASDITNKVNLPVTPYVVEGSASLKAQFTSDMLVGNTITTPGFFAPQGRRVRVPVRYPNMLNELTGYRLNKGQGEFLLTNFEMETAGYYAMARLLGHEAISLNAIIVNRANGTISNNPQGVVDGLIDKVLNRL